jgi:hypothetical protein
MLIRCLTFVVYGETGWGYHLEKIPNPTWDEIVAAIHRLEKFRYPWLWLFTGDEDEDPNVDCLTIMGGKGVYWLAVTTPNTNQLRLFDPNKGTHEIEVWTSDQGYADEERHVTCDIDLVLRVAKHFGETGEPLPEASWEASG